MHLSQTKQFSIMGSRKRVFLNGLESKDVLGRLPVAIFQFTGEKSIKQVELYLGEVELILMTSRILILKTSKVN